jgi:phosphatidylserine/phosphatidylglycerophosphate/cardiolipin synthase-like enzyme
VGQVDLDEARNIVAEAKRAIMFLMFNPGPKDTLLNKIIDTARSGNAPDRIYIRGVLNQDPSTNANPVELFKTANSEKADFDVVLPASVDIATERFRREMMKFPGTFAMVHSKVVLVDPFGPDPVLLTGSHNLGPKASRTNDENLLILRGHQGVASAYATNIMSVYNQYRWRFRRQVRPNSSRWKGLEDSDVWQAGYLMEGSTQIHEINFWVGE